MIARITGAWRTVSSGRAYVGGAWRPLVKARAYIGGEWREVASFIPPLSLSISPLATDGSRLGSGAITTLPVTATPNGGQAPYSYMWDRTAGFGAVNSGTSSTTTFSQSVGNGEEVTGTFRCTVTDNLGATATASVTATFTSFDMSGGA